ncbi:MAG: carboxyltransferase domain-containing protein, partial [Vicinamibacteria bacterium]
MVTLTYPRIVAVGDRAMTVELGGSMDAETVARVRALDLRLRERALEGVQETVPTYASLLVVYERSRISFTELEARLGELCRDLSGDTATGQRIEVPTVYNGEDLDEVAGACGLSRDDVIAL